MSTLPDPHRADRFYVEVVGLGPIGCSAVEGLETTVEVRQVPLAEYVPDWLAGFVGDRTVPRRVAVSPPLVLTRGVTDDDTLRTWFDDWIAGTADRRTVEVALLDANGDPTTRWRCENAHPTRWTGPRLRTDRPTVATESLELAHDGVELVG